MVGRTLQDLLSMLEDGVDVVVVGIVGAEGLGVRPHSFLMAVAIGASCAFLTPIGHQSAALVMVPGAYCFGDYFRLGLPLEVVILVTTLPLLMHFWPM